MERRPLAARIRWDNLARIAFVAGLAALVAWGPHGPGAPAGLPPDVGVTRSRPPAAQPPVSGDRRPLPRTRARPSRPRRAKRRHHRRRPRGLPRPSPAPTAQPAPAPAPPAAGGEFGP